MTVRIWMSLHVQGDEGEEGELVSLSDGGNLDTLMEMLNAGLLPLVVRPMVAFPRSRDVAEHAA